MINFSGKLNYRWDMINYVKRGELVRLHGFYNTTRKTVHTWINRYSEEGTEALKKQFPKKTILSQQNA